MVQNQITIFLISGKWCIIKQQAMKIVCENRIVKTLFDSIEKIGKLYEVRTFIGLFLIEKYVIIHVQAIVCNC